MIMRRRTTAEMDELVNVAGFRKMAMEVDRWNVHRLDCATHGAVAKRARLSA